MGFYLNKLFHFVLVGNLDKGKMTKEESAQEYLQPHKIVELLNNMTTMPVFNRPEDPKSFLIEQVEKLKVARNSGFRFPSVFGMLDPVKKGHITREQYCAALETLGIEKYNKYPHGSELNQINQATFLREAKDGISQVSATYRQ